MKKREHISVQNHDSRVPFLHFDVLIWSEVPPKLSDVDAHRHLFNELLFVTAGGGTHRIEFEEYSLLAQTIHLIPAGHVHHMQRTEGSAGFSLSFSDDFLPDAASHRSFFDANAVNFGRVIAPDSQTWNEIIALAEQMKSEFAQKQQNFLNVIRLLLSAVLLKTKRCQMYSATKGSDVAQMPEKLAAFRELLYEHGSTKSSVSDMAAKLFITPNYLNELCRTYLGQSAHEIIHAHLCTEAKSLLRYTTLTINEIADKLDFESAAYFSRFFKKQTSFSPLVYRNQSISL